jgi:hypothetical protein
MKRNRKLTKEELRAARERVRRLIRAHMGWNEEEPEAPPSKKQDPH